MITQLLTQDITGSIEIKSIYTPDLKEKKKMNKS